MKFKQTIASCLILASFLIADGQNFFPAFTSQSSSGPSPLLYYKLNEGTGTTMTDSGTAGINGTTFGSPPWLSPGLSFGSTSQYATTTSQPLTSNGSYTFCVWINETTFETAQDAYIFFSSVTPLTDGVFLGIDSSTEQFYVEVDGGFVESTTALSPSTRYFLVVTCQQGSPYAIKLYLNGVLETPSGSTSTSTLTIDSSNIRFAQQSTSNHPYNGSILSFQVYNTILTQSQITALNTAGPQ
jgi:hypothetical protein